MIWERCELVKNHVLMFVMSFADFIMEQYIVIVSN